MDDEAHPGSGLREESVFARMIRGSKDVLARGDALTWPGGSKAVEDAEPDTLVAVREKVATRCLGGLIGMDRRDSMFLEDDEGKGEVLGIGMLADLEGLELITDTARNWGNQAIDSSHNSSHFITRP